MPSPAGRWWWGRSIGKSTLINAFRPGWLQRHENPGPPRRHPGAPVDQGGERLELLDHLGMLWPKLQDQVAARRLAYHRRHPRRGAGQLSPGDSSDELMDIARQVAARITEGSKREGQALPGSHLPGPGYKKGMSFDSGPGRAQALDEFRAGLIGRITLEMPDAALKRTARPAGRPRYLHDQELCGRGCILRAWTAGRGSPAGPWWPPVW